MEIITVKKHVSEKDAHNFEKENDVYNNSPDKEYMKTCHEVDMLPPRTWDKYDLKTEDGIRKVIEMEYKELMDATSEKGKIENIYHLSVALLRYWRIMKKV